MKRILLLTIFLFLFSPSSTFAQKAVQDYLIKLDKQWATATVNRDMKTLNSILADDYTYTDFDGETGTKSKMLKDMAAHHAMELEAMDSSDYKVRVYGSTAVMTHLTAITNQDTKTRLQSMHVWAKRGANWKVVAHQWTVIAPRGTATPTIRAECAKFSYQPEVIAYFGDGATIINKLEDDRMGLPDRRGYLLLVETKQSAEFSFFERADDQHFRVSQWQGRTLRDLRERLTDVILENRGIACVGAQTKSIVKASFNPTDLGTIPMPLSAKAAFSHTLRKYGNEYLRVTILLLC
jgi:hypothetical protein